jgi:hypothetical protein
MRPIQISPLPLPPTISSTIPYPFKTLKTDLWPFLLSASHLKGYCVAYRPYNWASFASQAAFWLLS